MTLLQDRARVILVGKGRFAAFVEKNLSSDFDVIQYEDLSGFLHPQPESQPHPQRQSQLQTQSQLQIQSQPQAQTQPEPLHKELVMLLQDDWEPEQLLDMEKQAHAKGIPWLAGYFMEREGLAGPIVIPGSAAGSQGCSQCAEYRVLTAGNEREEVLSAQASLLFHGKIVREQPLPDTVVRLLASLVCREARSFLLGKDTLLTQQICLVHLETAVSTWHPVLPNPLCEVCGGLPEDTEEGARYLFSNSKKIAPGLYRSLPEQELEKGLMELYYDEKTGVLNQQLNLMPQPFAEVVMNLPTPQGNEAVGGRSHAFKSSKTTAVLEGLERLCGMSPRGKQTVTVQAYRDLRSPAMFPPSVGVYSEEQYGSPDFPFEPFDPDLPIPWVWGYSFKEQRPVLIPEQLAYYSGAGGFVHEFSNGCALGGNFAEAVFYGILEVVERDSFLMAWYGRLSLPRMDPASLRDKQLDLMLERLAFTAGYDIHIFDSTMEHGIPSVWAIAKNRKSGQANLLCSAGAHPDIARAVKSAVFELAGAIPRIEAGYREQQEHLYELFHHSDQVQQMEEHALLYSLPEAEERLSFLLRQNDTLPAAGPAGSGLSSSPPVFEPLEDMKDEMLRLVGKLADQGLDVLVVDQTSPELTVKGLHCVKVLIPGMLPMTFGHPYVRLTGLERVLDVPKQLGYKPDRLTLQELNPYPHPFL